MEKVDLAVPIYNVVQEQNALEELAENMLRMRVNLAITNCNAQMIIIPFANAIKVEEELALQVPSTLLAMDAAISIAWKLSIAITVTGLLGLKELVPTFTANVNIPNIILAFNLLCLKI